MTNSFKTHNQTSVDINGTSYQGEIIVNYATLKNLFGKPNRGDEYKIEAEWDIEFDDGFVATVYNWKNGKTYCGKNGIPKTKITEWHIGGKSDEAVHRIYTIINKAIKND